jgi:thymidylate kinase
MESSLISINWLNRLAINLMLAGVPKPDISYLLDVPEAESAKRKDASINIDYLKQLRQSYLKLAKRRHLNTKDTACEFEAIADETVLEVGVPYFNRYPTFLNGLFLSNPAQINRVPKKGQR